MKTNKRMKREYDNIEFLNTLLNEPTGGKIGKLQQRSNITIKPEIFNSRTQENASRDSLKKRFMLLIHANVEALVQLYKRCKYYHYN
jgi:hypothetical protein